jgi:hypothetical protein
LIALIDAALVIVFPFHAFNAAIFTYGLTQTIPLELFISAPIIHATCVPWNDVSTPSNEEFGSGVAESWKKSYQCSQSTSTPSFLQDVGLHILFAKSG